MSKKLCVLLLALAAGLVFAACGGEQYGQVPDLTGEWVQPSDGPWYHIATVTDDKIQIWWYLPSEDLRDLYWSGSFIPPEDDTEPYEWQSVNDLVLAYDSYRASREEVKTFTYQDGKITYHVTSGHLRMIYTLDRAENVHNPAADSLAEK